MDDFQDVLTGAVLIGAGFAVQGIPVVGQLVGATLFSFGAGLVTSGIGLGPGEAQKGIVQETRSTTAALPIVYGTTKIGGSLVDIRADPGSAGDNQFLVKVVALCLGSQNGSGIENVRTIWFDEERAIVGPELNDGPSGVTIRRSEQGSDPFFSFNMNYSIMTGRDDQVIPPYDETTATEGWLVAAFPGAWDQHDRGRGIAYAGFLLQFDQEVFPGIPTVQAEVDGLRVYDPRNPTGGPDGDGFAFSDNPWLCLLDYLTSERYGLGASYPERDGPKQEGDPQTSGPASVGDTTIGVSTQAGESILIPVGGEFRIEGDPTIYEATTELDIGPATATSFDFEPGLQQAIAGGESITVVAFTEVDEQSFIDAANHAQELVPYTQADGSIGYQNRHRFDGWLRTAADEEGHKRNIERLVQSTGGSLVHSGNQWRAVPRRPTAPVDLILDESVIVGSWSGRRAGIADAPNRVRATFVDEANEYQQQDVHWPETNAENPFLDEDAGFPSVLTLELPGVTDRARAQRMAQVALAEARADLTFRVRCTDEALKLQVGDVVRLRHPTPGFTAAEGFPDGKKFWVERQEILPEDERLEVDLILREYDADAYVTEVGSAPAETPDPDLPEPDESLMPDPVWYGSFDIHPPPDGVDPTVDITRTVYDRSKYDNDGRILKSAGFAWGSIFGTDDAIVGRAMEHDGGGSLAIANSDTAPELALGKDGAGLSICGWWAETTGSNQHVKVGNMSGSDGWRLSASNNGESVTFQWRDESGSPHSVNFTFEPGMEDGRYYHVVLTVSEADADGRARVALYIDGKWIDAQESGGFPIEAGATHTIGWGTDFGGDADNVRFVGRLDECMLFDVALTATQVYQLWRFPENFSANAFDDLDDVPDGDEYEKTKKEWVDDGRPTSYIDKIEVEIRKNDTCSGGTGFEVRARPRFSTLQASDEGPWRLYWEWQEDGVLVDKGNSTNIWDIAGGVIWRGYSDPGAGSDAPDATSHTLSVRFILVDESLSPPQAVDSKWAAAAATYGTC